MSNVVEGYQYHVGTSTSYTEGSQVYFGGYEHCQVLI